MKIICILLILAGLGQAEDIIFFADDHYKSISKIELYASATNPALVPGDAVLRISLANHGKIEELLPISSIGSPDDILLEMKGEMNSSDAMEIRALLEAPEPLLVTSGRQYIPVLPPGEARELQFNLTIDRRADGWYDLPLKLNYVHQVDVSASDGEVFPLLQSSNQSLNLRIYISGNKDDLRIAGFQSHLYPGGSEVLWMAVENIGLDMLPNCSASLLAVPPFHVTSLDVPLGELTPGEMALARFLVQVDGNASQEEYQLGLCLRSEKMDLVLPFALSLKGRHNSPVHRAMPLIAIFAILSLAIIIVWRGYLLYRQKKGKRRTIRRRD